MLSSACPQRKSRALRFETLEVRATPTIGMVEQQILADIMEQAPRVMPDVPGFNNLLRTNGTFSDLNYNSGSDAGAADIRVHARRVEALEIAYKWNDPSNTFYGNAALKAKLVSAWNYTANTLGYISAPNWWWREIGIPAAFSQPLILFRSELPANTVNMVLAKYFGSAWTNQIAANMTSQATPALIQGVLQNNASRIKDVVAKVSAEIVGYSGEGLARDLSFMQHMSSGRMNFSSGSYGVGFALDTTKLMRWTANTEFAFGAAPVDLELRFVLDHLHYLTRGHVMDPAAAGRSITRPGNITLLARQVNDAAIDLLPLGKRVDELNKAIDRYFNGVNETNYISGNRGLWVGDGMLHTRQDITSTLKMISSRTLRPETAAGENKKGFFEGDGMMMLLQDGDEYGTLTTQEIMPVWDWQRLPGTTVQHNGVIPYTDMFNGGTNTYGSSNLVGGASDNNYGVAMMDYRRSGVTLTARKSWFFFDDEIVALGADIDDPTANSPVFTSLNQVLLDGSITVSDATGGQRVLGLGSAPASLSGKSWIQHDNMGYVMLDSTNRTSVQAAMQSSSTGITLPVFSAWIDHGTKPVNATYAYAVVPDKSVEEIAAYSNELPITILANTANVQAVRHNGLGQTQIAFFAAGSLWIDASTKITVSQPCALIIKQSGDQLTITAADPRQGTTALAIDVNRQITGAGVTWNATTQTSRISFALPAAPIAGSSITRSYTVGAPTGGGGPTDPPPPPPPPPVPGQPVIYDATARTVTVAGRAGADDRINVARDSAGRITIQLNNVNFGPFTAVDRVIAFGQSGNDMIMANNLPIPVEFYGNDGNDTLYGGSAADLLFGGAGDDNIYGYAGHDVLIGGGGRDYIVGDAGNDLMFGGLLNRMPDNFLPAFAPADVGSNPWSADAQAILLALAAARAAWAATPSTMPTQLGTSRSDFSADGTIADMLYAGAGNDWFYAAAVQKDFVLDLSAGDRNGEL